MPAGHITMEIKLFVTRMALKVIGISLIFHIFKSIDLLAII